MIVTDESNKEKKKRDWQTTLSVNFGQFGGRPRKDVPWEILLVFQPPVQNFKESDRRRFIVIRIFLKKAGSSVPLNIYLMIKNYEQNQLLFWMNVSPQEG